MSEKQSTVRARSTPTSRRKTKRAPVRSTQGSAILKAAQKAGFLTRQTSKRVGGVVSRKLLSAAIEKSGIESETELLEYALSKVALEDDYGTKLLALKGSIPADADL